MIDCVLLVDDDATTNFLNEELIRDNNFAREVKVAWNGEEALDYLTRKGKFKLKENSPRPNIIFLDINMPVMDGFEFIRSYQKLPKSKQADILIVFLTTSDAKEDRLKARENKVKSIFLEKPLRKKDLKSIKVLYKNKLEQ